MRPKEDIYAHVHGGPRVTLYWNELSKSDKSAIMDSLLARLGYTIKQDTKWGTVTLEKE